MTFRFRDDWRCFLAGWVSAWAIAIFLSSALLAHFRMAPAAGDCGVSCFFDVVDEMAPQAKLMFGIVLGLLMLAARRRRTTRTLALAARDGAAATVAMALTLALLPAEWSRGFGTAIPASRFELWPVVVYLGSAVAGAVLGSLTEGTCRRTRAELAGPRS